MAEDETTESPAQNNTAGTRCDGTSIHDPSNRRITRHRMDFDVGDFTQLLRQYVILTQRIGPKTVGVLLFDCLAFPVVLLHVMIGPFGAYLLQLQNEVRITLVMVINNNQIWHSLAIWCLAKMFTYIGGISVSQQWQKTQCLLE